MRGAIIKIKRVILCIFTIIAISFAIAMTLRIAIGVGAWDALIANGSALSGIRVGTMGIIFNVSCVVLQLIILKKDFKFKHVLQVVLSLTLGYAINFFFYDVLSGIDFPNYFIRLILFITCLTFIAFAISVIMLLDIVIFPLEGACKVISGKTGVKFHILRQGVDAVSIVLALSLSFAFALPLTVREGTVIGMVLFGPLLGIFGKRLKPLLQKYNLADAEEELKEELSD